MLKMRIIPCLDIKNGQVTKGIQFKNHEIVGDILELAKLYSEQGADELVFYEITASSRNKVVDYTWIEKVAQTINIPFCVAGGIRTIEDAEKILAHGADKISINSPALENPDIIEQFAERFGSQCVVVGIDSKEKDDGKYHVYQYTGCEERIQKADRLTIDWVKEVEDRGAGEIVLNCMNQDGVRQGYHLEKVSKIIDNVNIPVIASGGAGEMSHFLDLFQQTHATGALAASVFHKKLINIGELKKYLAMNGVNVRISS